jgi:hypothetical protein
MLPTNDFVVRTAGSARDLSVLVLVLLMGLSRVPVPLSATEEIIRGTPYTIVRLMRKTNLPLEDIFQS